MPSLSAATTTYRGPGHHQANSAVIYCLGTLTKTQRKLHSGFTPKMALFCIFAMCGHPLSSQRNNDFFRYWLRCSRSGMGHWHELKLSLIGQKGKSLANPAKML